MAKEKEKPLSNEDMLKLIANKKGKPLTREDVLRLIEENGGTAKGLDLSGKVFEEGIDLSGLDISGVILNNTKLIRANFRGAHLNGAEFRGADLSGANLEGAGLVSAQLQKTILMDANLRKADLLFAKLQGTFLSGAKLQAAWLFGAELSSDTILTDADWGNYILKDEKEGHFAGAEVTYRVLKVWHTNAGIYDTAAKFYYREKEANRKALRLHSKDWHNRLAAESTRVLFGYGERWERILIWMAAVIFGLAAAYYFWGSFSSSSFLDTLYYSAVSFTALGYGQWAPQPSGWAKVMGAAEAFIGVSMMALLLVTFVRKWTR